MVLALQIALQFPFFIKKEKSFLFFLVDLERDLAHSFQ